MAKGVEVAAFTVVKTQALDVQYEVAKQTPVDVGTARSNWRLNVGRPYSGTIRAYSPFRSRHRKPYTGGGSKGEGGNLAGVQSQGKSRLAGYTKGSIYLSNNIPYIGPLSRGHSRQSSGGWVVRAVMSAVLRTTPKIAPIFLKEFSK